MKEQTLKAILFDMDGLLIDTERLYIDSERELAAEWGKTLTEHTIRKMMGRKPLESIRILLTDLQVNADPAKVLARRDEMMLKRMAEDLQPMPGMMEILERFRGRIPMALATGAVRPFVDIMIAKFSLDGVFSAIQTSEEVERGKPDPEIYLRAAARLGMDPANSVVIEDSENGIRAGHAAGCHTVAVPNEHTAAQDFTLADRVCRDLGEAALYLQDILK